MNASISIRPEPVLRGDYSRARPIDFVVEQDMNQYSADEHARWAALFNRQKIAAAKFGSSLFNQALHRLEQASPLHKGIPCLTDFNPTLLQHTGWKLVAVPGLIPDKVFFEHLAKRQFPVTTWIRDAHEMDYIVEPDIFHDFFGHVPLLTDSAIADFLHWYGKQASQANSDDLKKLARLYWYTIEYGLVKEGNAIRAFGAGLLTSRTELEHSVLCLPKHTQFNVDNVLQSDYAIDTFQTKYFVLEDFQELLGLNRLAQDE
jgi:phenylalanine-4-hydroxylase